MSISTSCAQLLQLSAIKGLGLKTFHHLHREMGSVQGILDADFQTLKQLGIKKHICDAIGLLQKSQQQSLGEEYDRIQLWSEDTSHYVICLEDSLYPAALREIYCPPPLIYVKGQLDVFGQASIAMVGSRRPSISGEQHAFSFARDLSLSSLCINSGLAIGVDSASHKGALQGGGRTCAVLATGLDVIYPKQHIELAYKICEQGALVSEMSLGSLPVPASFPRRNRIISGLSQGVLVVEASLKSGSLITANYAAEQNRDVYAIPGCIDSPVSSGCHALIKQGAKLVESVEDILEDGLMLRAADARFHATKGRDATQQRGHVTAEKGAEQRTPSSAHDHDASTIVDVSTVDANTVVVDGYDLLSDEERKVINYVDYQCVSFDLLVHYTELETNELTHVLIGLELKGLLCSVPGGYQRVKAVHSPA